MPDDLTVHVNRTQLYSLDLPESYETSESFDVRLVNHGEATHVHLHVDDALSEVAVIDAPNHHLDANSERRVRLTLTRDGTARGNLKIVTGYGSTTRYVNVEVTEPNVSPDPVEVSEDLTKPQPRSEPTLRERLADSPYLLPAVGAVALAFVIVVAAAVLQDALVVAAVVLLAVGGLVAAVLGTR